jgi:hypothetical protein
MTTYQCSICKLQFSDAELARRCEEWCATHDSCNLEIGRQAINRGSTDGCCDERFPN